MQPTEVLRNIGIFSKIHTSLSNSLTSLLLYCWTPASPWRVTHCVPISLACHTSYSLNYSLSLYFNNTPTGCLSGALPSSARNQGPTNYTHGCSSALTLASEPVPAPEKKYLRDRINRSLVLCIIPNCPWQLPIWSHTSHGRPQTQSQVVQKEQK